MKQNLTQEVQGQLFGMIQSDANKWLQLLRPVLHAAFHQLDVLPGRLATIAAAPDVQPSDGAPFFIMMARNVPSSDQ